MKKIIAISLIFILSGQCLYRLGLFTYFELNRDYIAQVLCINKNKPMTMCYGQCFLDRGIAMTDVAEDEQLPTEKIEKVETIFFLVSQYRVTFQVGSERSLSYALEEEKHYHYQSFTTIFQPPEA